MRIAFYQFYPPTLWTPGGGEVQLAKTREALLRKGVEVSLFDPWSRAKDFDLLHVFGSGYELSSFVRAAKGLGLPVAVSVIAFSAKPRWEWSFWKRVDSLIPLPTTYRLRQEIYDYADVLIAASKAEAEQLMHGFRINAEKFVYVPHGIEAQRFEFADPDLFYRRFGLKDFVLQVSRVNRLKGQVRLIEALKAEELPLVFIGPLDPTDPEGTQEFVTRVQELPWVHYLGAIDHDDPLLASAYAAAKVHVLPSLITESPGLVTLEAAASGAAVVSGRYPTLYDYVGSRIYYCDQGSLSSIQATILDAYTNGPQEGLRQYVLDHFSWDKVADELIHVYKQLVDQTGHE